jgi:ATP-binding cassette subfamily B protein
VLGGTPRVLRLVWEAHPRYATVLLILTVVQGLVPLAQVWITKLIVDAAVAAIAPGAAGAAAGSGAALPELLIGTVLGLLALQAGVSLVGQAAEPANRLVQQQLGDYLSRDINLRILRKAAGLADLTFFESPTFYDLLQRAQQEAGFRPLQMLQQMTMLLRAAVGLLAMLGVLVGFQPLLALAVVCLALPHVIIQFRHQHENWTVQSREIPEVRRMDYFRQALTSSTDAKEIRIFGLAGFFLGRYLDLFDAYRRRHQQLHVAQWRRNSALAALAALASTGAYAYVVLEALLGRITPGSLTLYASAINQVQTGLSGVVTYLAGLYESNLFASHLFEFLALPPTMPLPPPGQARPVPVPLQEGIEFRHVTFRYPGTERLVLEDVSFTIRPGEAVALVGENGAGKTTLVKLLARLYDPTEGQILVDGVDLREYDLDQWRRQIGVIFQDYSRYHLTARENVGVGQVERVDDLPAVQAAAAWSGADAVIARLPQGYDTTLGRRFWAMVSNTRSLRVEEGVDLAGGEWQKIALARAFMRAGTRSNGPSGTRGDPIQDGGEAAGSGNGHTGDGRQRAPATGPEGHGMGPERLPPDEWRQRGDRAGADVRALDAETADGATAPDGHGAQLLILDEPTAALDAQAEYDVYLRFHELTREKATLLISHRFSTVKMADHIVVLERGRVIERGSHDELLQLGGRYATLYQMQAARYR